MNSHQKRIIMKSFIISQFGYCPLVWMFTSRTLNHRINRIHERALRIAFNDQSSSFEDLLCRDNSVTIHVRNLQTLAIELYKIVNNISPEIMKNIFFLDENKRYPTKSIFKTTNIRTTHFGLESLAHLGPKIWNILSRHLKVVI